MNKGRKQKAYERELSKTLGPWKRGTVVYGGATFHAYIWGRWCFRRDFTHIWQSHRPRKVVNWVLMRNGVDLDGVGRGFETLTEGKARLAAWLSEGVLS